MRLGKADDLSAADGKIILTCEQAKSAARAWYKELQKGCISSRDLTVGHVLDAYLAAKAAEAMKSLSDTRSRIETHIRPRLGGVRVADLSPSLLCRWRDDLVTAPKRVRTSRLAKEVQTRVVDLTDGEALRRRKDTANRTLTVLKAALNWAMAMQMITDDSAWRSVKPFKGTTAARVRYLIEHEQQVLLDSCQGDLRDLVAAALMTGVRFGDLSKIKVGDFDEEAHTLFVGGSKTDTPRRCHLNSEATALFASRASGRSKSDYLLLNNGKPWTPGAYRRNFNKAVSAAKLEHITLHELRHSFASTMVRKEAPMPIVANALGHRGTRMAEKHYAHLSSSHVAEVTRRTSPSLKMKP